MNGKIVYILLMCLVTLPIIYGCCSIPLYIRATHYTDVTSFEPTLVTKQTCQNVKPSYPRPNLSVLGDPIDDPKPR